MSNNAYATKLASLREVSEKAATKNIADETAKQVAYKQSLAEYSVNSNAWKAAHASNPNDVAHYQNEAKAAAKVADLKSLSSHQTLHRIENDYQAKLAKAASEREAIKKAADLKAQSIAQQKAAREIAEKVASQQKLAAEKAAKATADKFAAHKAAEAHKAAAIKASHH